MTEHNSNALQAKHSEGPFKLYPCPWVDMGVTYKSLSDKDGNHIARIVIEGTGVEDGQGEANGALFAAALDLLAALRSLHKWCDDNINGSPLEYGKIMVAADAAIAKAEGRQ